MAGAVGQLRGGPEPEVAPGVLARAAIALGIAGLLAVAALLVPKLPVSPSLPEVVAGGVALMGVLALAVVRFDAAVTLGLCLLPIVAVEPAPTDAVLAVVIAVAVVSGRFDLRRVPLLITSSVGALIAVNLLSVTESVDAASTARFLGITLYLALFGVWYAAYLDSRSKARTLVRVYLAGAVVSAIVGAAALKLPIPARDVFLGDGATRARALFKDPNVFGPFMIPIAMILLEERFRPRLLRLRGLTNALLLAILGAGILFSFSRAAWGNAVLSACVTLGVLTLRRGGGRRTFRILVGLAAALVIVGAAASATGSISFIQQRAHYQTYDTERFGAQRAGLALVRRYPVGVGPGQFGFHYPIETHSTYIRVLAEQGYAGLAIWIVLILATLVLALRNAALGRDAWGIGSAALLGSWCGLLLNSAVVDTLHWRHLWLVAALIWAAAVRRPERAAQSATGSASRVRTPA
jgi:O-antigen ligase